MNKKVSVSTMLTVSILAMTVTFSITMLLAMRLFDSTVASVKEKESMYAKLAEVDRFVRANDYYSLDEEALYDTISSGYMLGTGDRYARYYTAAAYAELLRVQSGQLMGIGVELGRDITGYMKVTQVYAGSPAEELGMVRGCYITAIDGVDVRSLSGADAAQTRLRGEAGTTVQIVWLDGEMGEKVSELTRYGYVASTVPYTMIGEDVGYIRIRQFDSTTPSELDRALQVLKEQGAVGIVFDLRDNAGGLLEQALRCLQLVCPEGTLAYSMAQSGLRTVLGSSTGHNALELPVTCVVNGNTASSAELFASCLRIRNGARLIGTATMGKGTIQSSPQRLSDGSAVVVTVAQLLTCDGSSFDGVGLAVDVERPLTADEEAIFYDYTAESDPQVLRAVSTVRHMAGASTVGANS